MRFLAPSACSAKNLNGKEHHENDKPSNYKRSFNASNCEHLFEWERNSFTLTPLNTTDRESRAKMRRSCEPAKGQDRRATWDPPVGDRDRSEPKRGGHRIAWKRAVGTEDKFVRKEDPFHDDDRLRA